MVYLCELSYDNLKEVLMLHMSDQFAVQHNATERQILSGVTIYNKFADVIKSLKKLTNVIIMYLFKLMPTNYFHSGKKIWRSITGYLRMILKLLEQ